MAVLPPNTFVTNPDPEDEHRFTLDEAALMAAITQAAPSSSCASPPAARPENFAEDIRQLEELADPLPAFIAAPSEAYLQAVEQVEICLRRRGAARG